MKSLAQLMMLFCGCVLAHAADYFVSPAGEDGNAGTVSAPFRTLGRGIRNLQPGDTLFIRTGTYIGSSQVPQPPSGDSWEKPVTIRGYRDERPIIVAEPQQTVLYITGAKYVILENLVIDAKGGHDGIKLTYFTGGTQAHHIRIRNCEVKNASNQGLLVAGEGNEFIDLDVHDNGTTGFHHGIYLSAEGNLIDGGKYYRNAGWGIHVYPKASNTVVRNVKCFENRATGLGLVWGASNAAYNNVVYSNGSGIHLSGDSPRCYNNTVYGNRGEGLSVANADNGPNGTRKADVRNNIVWQNESGITDYATGTGTVLSNNLESDPGFIDPAAADFRLRADSPAVDKGADLRTQGVTMDRQGTLRPQGAAFDIGAYERSAFPAVNLLPLRRELPDPLLMLDGRRVTTTEQWFNERRPELVALFQHYMYGFLPAAPATSTGTVHREDRAALNGRATIKQVTVNFSPKELKPIHLMLVVPNHRQCAAPVILGMNYFGNHTLVHDRTVALSTNWMPERGEGVVNNRATEVSRGTWVDIWQIEKMVARGYAVATFYNGDVDPDRTDERGIQVYYREQDPGSDCGTIAAWAWGLQRAVDYLVTDRDIDGSRIVVTGHSRLGKAALLAGALDTRIALVIPHQAGSGGSAPSRIAVTSPKTISSSGIKQPETVKQLNEKFPHWFNATFKEFNPEPERLPFDQHCLVALCAPRPVLFSNGRQDTWINPEGQFSVLRAAAPVYRLLQAGDLQADELPPDGQLVKSTLGFFVRPGGHSLRPEDWKAFMDFADTHLGSPSQPRQLKQRETAGTGATSRQADPAMPVSVPRWEIQEFVLRGDANVENPFAGGMLSGKFTAPSEKARAVEGFYDGDGIWRLRFAPDEEGDWQYRIEGPLLGIVQVGSFRCTAPRGRGFIRPHPQNPYAFAHADGTAYFPMGDTCYGLFDDSPITPALRREYIETRRRQRFNFVRMSIGHSEARAAADPPFWAWGGSAAKPDLDRLNPVFFRGLDELFRELQAHEMNVELLLLNFYRKPFTDTNQWTSARERLWLRYIVARYGAFNNVFLWTVANEYETHPDGRYRLDHPEDVEWAKTVAQFIKAMDPYRHPVTTHPVISASTKGKTPRDRFEPPWRIGEFFGDDGALDVLSQQTAAVGDGVSWDDRLRCWVGDDQNLVASLRADRRFGKPVLNTENGYEYLRGHPTEKNQVHHTDKVRRSAWRIVCAGGYFAAGFHGTIGHSDVWNRIDAPNRYTFAIADEGAAGHCSHLYRFFVALPFWRMEPFAGITGNGVALAEVGKVYVAYLPHGGEIGMDLTAPKGSFAGCWFNPRTGEFEKPFNVPTPGQPNFTAPDDADWALLVQRSHE